MEKLRILIILLIILLVVASACDVIEKQEQNNKVGQGQPGGKGNSGSGGSGSGGGGNGGSGSGGQSGGPGGGRHGPGMGSGMMGGMHSRHMAQIPGEYAGLLNPVSADQASFERGGVIYIENCASCHGDGGMGDGPAGTSLNPAPSPVAHTSLMMGDDYLFWRISEGGLGDPFNSAMPIWKNSLSEDARWDVINYMRALGRGEIRPGKVFGGKMFDPSQEAAQRQEMLSEAITLDVITEGEADVFDFVHAAIDQYLKDHRQGFTGRMEDVTREILVELVTSSEITKQQADIFLAVHDRLVEAGLME